MGTLPTIPATYGEQTIVNFNRGQDIREDRMEDLLEDVNFVTTNRTKQHVNKSWMFYDVDTSTWQGVIWDIPGEGDMLGIGRFTTGADVTWILFRTAAEGDPDDGWLTLRIGTDYALTDERRYTNVHPNGAQSAQETMVAVEPETTYYFTMEMDNAYGTGYIELTLLNITELELGPEILSMHVPEYDTCADATTGLSPTGYELACINGQLCCYIPGERFEAGGITGADGLWIPYKYRDLVVMAAYKGGTDEAASPNSDWLWTGTTTGGGAISEAGDVTSMTTVIANDTSYLSWSDEAFDIDSWSYLIYAHVECTAGDATNASRIAIRDNVGASTYEIYYTLSSGGVANDWEWTVTNNSPISMTGTVELLMILDSSQQLAIVYDYQTMKPLHGCQWASFAASASTDFRIGDWRTGVTGSTDIEGYPAMAIMKANL